MPANVTPIIVLVAVVAIFYFMLILPQQRRTRAHRELVAGLKNGDEVMTIGGVIGTVRGVTDDRLKLEVASGVELTVARQAIAQKIEKAKEGA
ncbi:MAG: preprotein translocase subunit YajC [Actinomycetota bacterium]